MDKDRTLCTQIGTCKKPQSVHHVCQKARWERLVWYAGPEESGENGRQGCSGFCWYGQKEHQPATKAQPPCAEAKQRNQPITEWNVESAKPFHQSVRRIGDNSIKRVQPMEASWEHIVSI